MTDFDVSALASPRLHMERNEALRLGICADALDRYDLIRAIKRCDDLVAEIRGTQLIHTQNLCRVANRLAFDD